MTLFGRRRPAYTIRGIWLRDSLDEDAPRRLQFRLARNGLMEDVGLGLYDTREAAEDMMRRDIERRGLVFHYDERGVEVR